VARINRDGSSDLGFGNKGITRLPVGTYNGACGGHCGPYASLTNLLVLGDGEIAAVGAISQYDVAAPNLEVLDRSLHAWWAAAPPSLRSAMWQSGQDAPTRSRRFATTPARITVRLQTEDAGRERGGKCRSASPRLVRDQAKICTRTRRLTIKRAGLRPAGSNTVAISYHAHGRIRLEALVPASNVAGTSLTQSSHTPFRSSGSAGARATASSV
jgi:hypothetical protein